MPLLLAARHLVQGLFLENQHCDDLVTPAKVATWSWWYFALPALEFVTLPCCFFPCPSSCRVELQACFNANKRRLACVMYLHAINCEQTHVYFLLGKSRVCLKKTVSVPRLELMAAEMSVLVFASIKLELIISVDSITYWTDATCVLHYIKTQDIRPVLFVGNGLGKMHAFSVPEQWCYIPTDKNPADIGPHGLSPHKWRDISV